MADDFEHRPVPRSLVAAISEEPWAIQPSVLRVIAEAARQGLTPEEIKARAGFQTTGSRTDPASPVRVIPVRGVISLHPSFMSMYFGGSSVDELSAQIGQALSDPAVSAVVLDIASPGGTVAGVTEFAAELRSLRKGPKPLVASFNPVGASAAYWVGAQCTEAVVTPSGSVGSVGVYVIVEDDSQMLARIGIELSVIASSSAKADAAGVGPLSDNLRAELQAAVDSHAAMFAADVAKGRNTTVDAVLKTYGQGRMFMAADALAIGMVDRVESLPQTIARLARGRVAPAGVGRAEGGPDITEEPQEPETAVEPAAAATDHTQDTKATPTAPPPAKPRFRNDEEWHQYMRNSR